MLATIEGKFNLQNSMGEEVRQAFVAIEQIKKLNSSGNTQRTVGVSEKYRKVDSPDQNELVYVDDMADNGSIQRTYFQNIDQMSDYMRREKMIKQIVGRDTESGKNNYVRRRPLGSEIESASLSNLFLEKDLNSASPIKTKPLNPSRNIRFDSIKNNMPVFVSSSDKEIREAREPENEQQETGRLFTVDFDDLIDESRPRWDSTDRSQMKSKGPSSIQRRHINVGTQTDTSDSHAGLCSKCLMNISNPNLVLSFGTTPKDPSKLHSELKKISGCYDEKFFLTNSGKQNSSGRREGQRKNEQSTGNKRILFRQKISSPVQQELSSIFSGPQIRKTPAKLNQQSYLSHFENRLIKQDNSDIKYFSLDKSKRSSTGTVSQKKITREQAYLKSIFDFKRSYSHNSGNSNSNIHSVGGPQIAPQSLKPRIKMKTSHNNNLSTVCSTSGITKTGSNGHKSQGAFYPKVSPFTISKKPSERRLPINLDIDLREIHCLEKDLNTSSSFILKMGDESIIKEDQDKRIRRKLEV